MRTEFLCVSVLRVASGPRVKLASCKSVLNPWVVYSADRSKAVIPVLVLLFVALWFILRGDLFYVLTLCYFVLEFFSPFSIAITSLGEERANLSTLRTFVWFVFVWVYRFSLPLGVWKGLQFVILAPAPPTPLDFPLTFFKALLQPVNFTLGPDVNLYTEKHKSLVRIKAPTSVNGTKRKHKNHG